MLAEDLRALVGQRPFEVIAREIYRSLEAVAGACRGERLKSRAVVVDVAKCCGGDEQEWNLRWGLAYLHLEEAGRQDLLPTRGELPDREALREAAVDTGVLLRAIKVTELEQHRLALLKAEPLLHELDEVLPTTTEKNGRNAAECWSDLTDYLRRLILLFSHDPIPTDDRGHADLTVVLDRLCELGTLTGVQAWRTLSVRIRSAYDLAQHTGWYSVDPGQTGLVAYGDEFAHVRAEAGRKASELARVSAFLDAKPALVPRAAVDRDRYDPPRSAYLANAVILALLAITVTVVLMCVDASTDAWVTWGYGAGIVVLPTMASFVIVGTLHACRD
ncbi:hypothetical protein [Streptomyces sp. NPDC057689]|uniref:hypothetical protein n=1 Tax=Streptomyces sp. NPDC057689 TaxID=3346213 RepID=UPI00369EBEF7